MSSGTMREMAEWIEYMTMPGTSPMVDLLRKNGHDQPWEVKFFGAGKATWAAAGIGVRSITWMCIINISALYHSTIKIDKTIKMLVD